LVVVLTEFPSPGIPLSLVYPSRRHLAPRTRVVFDFIVEQVRPIQELIVSVSDQIRSA